MTTNQRTLAAEAGRFRVFHDGTVEGPADYMRSARAAETWARIENGTHVLIAAAPEGLSLFSLIAVALQTDYAAWAGQRGLDTFREVSRE